MNNKKKLIEKINQVINDLITADTTIITKFPQGFPEAEVLDTMKIMHESTRKKMIDLVEDLSNELNVQ